MGIGFTFVESDGGSKAKARRAYQRTSLQLEREFMKAAKTYWEKVYETAKQLCFEYVYSGPESPHYKRTGTLYDSIRLIWEAEPYGGLYEVAISSQGVEMVAMIKVGGGEFINPTTGKICDYAQAVHDGTRYMRERPFLTDAIALNEGFLQTILEQHVNKALSAFERDY